MRLVYTKNQEEVKIGDKVQADSREEYEVIYFKPPHKPSSSGSVTVKLEGELREFYVGVIGAEWIEREDR